MAESTAKASASGEASPAQLNAPRLFLSALQIENFRSFSSATFHFKPGLNVILGENNSAKTAVVDCLRLLLNLGTFENKEDFVRPRNTDVHLGDEFASPVSIAITGTFLADLESKTPSRFHELLCLDADRQLIEFPGHSFSTLKLRYQVDFQYSDKKGRYESVRSTVRGGPLLDNPVPLESLDAIRSIYLAPLRDLVNDRSRVGAEIERLILSHTRPGKATERSNLPRTLREKAAELISEVTGGAHEIVAGENLARYSAPSSISSSALSFTPTGISDALLSTLVPIFDHSSGGVRRELPLSSNGLGINQLIYASVVLSRQGSEEDVEYLDDAFRFFVIEEPEAHLHPQLQDSFFHALNEIREHQLFVTSHSPTISAKTDVARIIVMRRNIVSGTASPMHLASAYESAPTSRKYLHKFLDVTRSQLLFARGVVFVEGITEAMLMQQFSEIVGVSLRDRGIEIVVVDSNHGFNHFRPLFENAESPIARAAFVTDSDVKSGEILSDQELRTLPGSQIDKIVQLHPATIVARGYGTFEFGLLRQALGDLGSEFMRNTLREAMKKASPDDDVAKTEQFVKDFMSFDEPSLVYKKMKQSRANEEVPDERWHGKVHTNDRFRKAKSDFAYQLSSELEKHPLAFLKEQFSVPWYIDQAIRFVASGGASDGAD